MQAIFQHLTVIDLSSVLAGPSVATFFAELGARVIKYENSTTGGDVTRTWKVKGENPDARTSAYWASINYRKEIHFVDLRDGNVQRDIHQQLRLADIVITNFKHGDAAKFNLEENFLRATFPHLIIASIYGYHSQPQRVAYDVVLQAETGYMFMNGEPQSAPTKMPVAMMDVLAAHQLKEGILCALIQKATTGSGCIVKCSLEKAGISGLVNQASNFLMTGNVPQRLGSKHPNIAPYGEVFHTKDQKQIVLAIGSDKQFHQLTHILSMPELVTDERFENNVNRVKNRETLAQLLQEKIGYFQADEFVQSCIAHDVPAGKIKDLNDVFATEPGRSMVLEEMYEGEKTLRVQSVAFELY